MATASLVLSSSSNALVKVGRVSGFTTMLCISNHKPQFIVGTITPLPPLSNLDFRRSFTTLSTTPHRQHHQGFFPSYCRLQSPEKAFSTLPFQNS
ncbi:unnamed protein product [Lactuca virosa]|uniref:Uncharacterized protein n=1 Tax=Lactuca virosa TaxID=75947 RepID=A0AAU9LXQ6_9ASTR|nr:unnamed protein product [Lactuca virosa]